MLIPPGQNLKYFDPLVSSLNFVAKVTACSNRYTNSIGFRVPTYYKEIVKQCLNEAAVGATEHEAGEYGRWFNVLGLVNIKKSLDRLHEKSLITHAFYHTLVEQFPKAYGGTLNLSSMTITQLTNVNPLESIFTLGISQLSTSLVLRDNSIRIEPLGIADEVETLLIDFTFIDPSYEPRIQPKAINGTQKNIIEGALSYIFEDIQRIHPASDALKVVELISKKNELTKKEKAFLKKCDCLDSVKFVRTILEHPYPQNRAIGDATTNEGVEGVKDGRVYYWKNGFGTGVKSEPQGLLGLSARNDETALPITREAAIDYINELIGKEKIALEKIDKKEKRKFAVMVKKAQNQAQRLAFVNLRAQILGIDDNMEARLVREAFNSALYAF
jgi:hypothetical protein